MLPLLVPLFLSALRRADDLTLAMEARGYTGGRGRTSFIELQAVPRDYLALACVTLFCLLIQSSDFRSIDGLIVLVVGNLAQGVLGLLAR